MWFLLLYLQISTIQGQVKQMALRGSNSPCEGRLEVRGGKGTWGLVCHYGWTRKNAEVVCKSLRCGDVVWYSVEKVLYKDSTYQPGQYFMDQVNCISSETSLWDCSYIQPNDQKCKDDSFVAVKCSGKVDLRLNLNGQSDKCAGVVEFSSENSLENKTFGVCHFEWDKSKAKKICQELNCGDHYHIPKPGMFTELQSKQNGFLNCDDKKDKFSWQCMDWPKSHCKDRASVICTKHMFRLRDGSNLCSGLVEKLSDTGESWVPLQQESVTAEVICTQLNCGTSGNFTKGTNNLRLTCSDNVKLSKTKCFGDVNVQVNGADYGVCFNEAYSDLKLGGVVCRELSCGGVLDVKQGGTTQGLLSNVECLGDELSLWHCLAKHEKKTCKGTTVICAGSLDVRLSDGLGRCSGRVELQWEGSWRSISSKDWKSENSEVVCEHLKCGKLKNNSKLFIEGKQEKLESPWNFKCKTSSAKLHECLDKSQFISHSKEPNAQIFCQKEEPMFFASDVPCQGEMRIKTEANKTCLLLPENKTEANETCLLQPESKTEANETCHAMQCGDVVSFKKQNSTYANVSCSGSVNVTLQNKLNESCWGTVEVCRGKKCGGVCRNTWGDEESKKICDNLGCGESIPKPNQGQLTYSRPVNDYSVYCLNEVQHMNTCTFIPNDGSCKDPAQVICSGSIKARLEDPRDKCAGNVLLFYAGDWTPVCQESLDKNLKDTICGELNCGQSTDPTDVQNKTQITGVSGIKCNSATNFPNVSKCDLKGISRKNCTVGYLKCTGQKRLLLYQNEGPCSGPVYALSGEKTQLVSGEGWGQEEGQKMCEYLQCGNYTSHSTKPEDTKEWWNKTYKCSGKKDMWECERHDQAIQLHEQLNIKCNGKPPGIMLSNSCIGMVRLNNEPVFDFGNRMYDDLCDSLGCGKHLDHWSTTVSDKTDCWHFSCTGKETLLWQCGFKKGRCDKILSVACKKGIEFGSTEKCGGKLLVKYRDQWEYVCQELNAADTREVCKVLNCRKPVGEREINPKEIRVTIKCPESSKNISLTQCVELKKENTCKPAEIKCEGYTEKTPSPVNSGLIVGLSLGMLGLLIMVFMWINRKRLLLALRRYRNKNGTDINIDRNEMNNMEEEDEDLSQGRASSLKYDYEDVDSVKNKTGEEDADDRSEGSSVTEYDDIEGQTGDTSPHQTHADDNLPLLPKRPYNILADQDTYEVEAEKQEDYDDVMPVENAGRAGTQAQVDVDEDAGTDSEAGTGVNADAVAVTTEVDVHAEQE